jgi:hypothetical protein
VARKRSTPRSSAAAMLSSTSCATCVSVQVLEIDELDIQRAATKNPHVGQKIAIPDIDYGADFWRDVDDEGVGGQVGSR